MADVSAGLTFEARAHRLFLAQGSFAERGLLPAATADRRMLATDIDVLVSEYGSGFHLTRRHVECKSGKFALLDRILWLNGVRTLLGADSSYLIAADVDLSASEFARGLDVQLFTGLHLDGWEKSLAIPADGWPCRSDFATFDAARATWNRLSSEKSGDEAWRVFRAALAFIEVESWLTFRYKRLNRLFRLIGEISKAYDSGTLDRDQQLCARYVFSALLVRLSQYVLAMCADVASIMPLDVDRYISSRLTFGDQDPTQAADFTKATVAWVREALQVKGITMPPDVDPARLQVPPAYTPEVVSLIRRLLEQSHEARYLPLAVERMQFGLDTDDKLTRFRAAAGFADTLAALLKAFVARTFKVSNGLAATVHADLMAAYKSSTAATVAPPSPTPAATTKPPQRSGGRSKWPSGYPRSKGRDPKPTMPDPKAAPVASTAPTTKPAPTEPNATTPTKPDQPDLLTVSPEEKK
jgi:hypothetical protein